MSYVYRAQDIETGATVAVKILLPRLSRIPPRSSGCGARPPSPPGSTIPTSARSCGMGEADG